LRLSSGGQGPDSDLGKVLVYLGRVEGQTGREAEAVRTLRTALSTWEEATNLWQPPLLDLAFTWLYLNCDALAELPGSPSARSEALKALLRFRASIVQRDRQLGVHWLTEALPYVDFEVAKLQRLSGLADAKRETIRRLDSELGRYFAEAEG